MADPTRIEQAVKRARNQKAFIQDLLIDALGWDIDERAEEVEEISFEWSADELRAEGLEKHLVDGTIRQIRPMAGNPWGIFILEFNRPDLFATGRGMTGPLRKVLRGLVPSKKKKSSLASFGRENLLFICNHDYQHYRFVHFKTPGQDSQTAPLAAFGWGPGDPIRTLCEYNLTALEWPDGSPDAQGWIDAWSQAFDVEKVTKRFYADYAAVFAKAEAVIGKYCSQHTVCGEKGEDGTRRVPTTLAGDDLRMFTQTLFNRLMFLRFIERKQWLTFEGHNDYLRALYAAGGYRGKSFYKGRLRPLFFEGMSIEGKQQSEAYGRVPCLNGGLFEPTELDNRVTDLPDEVFEGILADEHAGGLFYRYNFTVEESTPLDIEVAVDPEMLGKVFEELVTGRHESGSYYTPRPVVSFMCREALKGYLSGKVGNVVGTRRVPSSPSRRAPSKPTAGPTTTEPARTENPLHSAIAALVDQQDAGKLRETHAREIVAALDDLKAVDPACGSGAYLLGLLQEMVGLYRLLYSEKLVKDARSLYDLKLRIVSQSLYGVDIDRFATNIAKLRLWLSLAVEADEPVPLPNLDFKIETGDSLLAPDPQQMPDLFRAQLQYSADVLAMVKNQFFLSHGEEKEEYRHTIMSEESRLRQELAAEHGEGVVDWRIQFAEVFASNRGGFDIVLANPPYVSAIEFARRHPATYRQHLNSLYRSARGAYDLYVLFFERSLQCLRPGGTLSFITPNKYLAAKYAAALRDHILQFAQLLQLVDISGMPVFHAAAVYPVLSFMRKRQRQTLHEYHVSLLHPPQRSMTSLDLTVYRRSNVSSTLLTLLPENIWGFLLSSHIELLVKVISGATPLALIGAVNATTTAGEADEYGAYLTNRSCDNAFKVVNTGTIDRYVSHWGRRPMRHKGKSYTTPYLPARDVSERRRRMYGEPKIIFAKMARECEALLDSRGEYASLNTNCFYAPQDDVALEFICGFCNSTLFMFLYRQFFGALRMSAGYFQFQAPQLRVIPLRVLPPEAQQPFVEVVRSAVSCGATFEKRSTTEMVDILNALDRMFYEAYGLSMDEVAEIEAEEE